MLSELNSLRCGAVWVRTGFPYWLFRVALRNKNIPSKSLEETELAAGKQRPTPMLSEPCRMWNSASTIAHVVVRDVRGAASAALGRSVGNGATLAVVFTGIGYPFSTGSCAVSINVRSDSACSPLDSFSATRKAAGATRQSRACVSPLVLLRLLCVRGREGW